jgi:hypothetical protein
MESPKNTNTRLRIVDGEEPARKPKRKDPNAPWSLRGISSETRALVAKAAERERRTVGAWVNFHLGLAATRALGGSTGGAGEAPAATANLPSVILQEQILAALLTKVTQLADSQAQLQQQVGQLTQAKPSLLGRLFGR